MKVHQSRVFFKISDIVNHPLRNYKRYPEVVIEKNFCFDQRFGHNTSMDIYYSPAKKIGGKYPVLVNVHGGGFVCGDKKYRSGIACFFAMYGYLVVNVNYRLSPQFGFPAATEDTLNALTFLKTLEEKYSLDLEKIVMTGDSAGGFYAAHAVAAIYDDKLSEGLGFGKYEGPGIRALMTFSAPFDLYTCFSKKTPLNVSADVSECVFGTRFLPDGMPKDFKFAKEVNICNYVNSTWPECYLIAAQHDSFCGGQIENMLETLEKNGVKHGHYLGVSRFDGHCTHLLPFLQGSPLCMKAATDFLNSVSGFESK